MTVETRPRPSDSSSQANIGRVRHALASGARRARAGVLSASVTFGWRALLKIKHVPEQLGDVTMFRSMFVLMFTYLFGGRSLVPPASTCSSCCPASWCRPS